MTRCGGYRSVDDQTPRRDGHSAGELGLDGVEVVLLGLERDVSKVLWLIAKGSVLVRGNTAYMGDTVCVAGKPVEADQVSREFAFGDERLDCPKEQGAMSLSDDANAALGGLG